MVSSIPFYIVNFNSSNVILFEIKVEIMNQLLVHDPSIRVSADDLLKSPNMHPSLFDKQPEFFQFLNFLLLPQKEFKLFAGYYQLMRRCLQQNTQEAQILKWLDGKEHSYDSLSRNDSLTLHRHPSILQTFFKRCEEREAQYFQVSLISILSFNYITY